MSRMSELAQVLDELVACGKALVQVAGAMRTMLSEADTEARQPPTMPTAPAPLPRTYTFEEVRQAFAEKSHQGYTEQIRAIITGHGAARLSAVKQEDYPALMAELEGLQ